MAMTNKVTINQLAQLAGVSRGTVDKVLHARDGVSAPVRQRVARLATEYGYVVHSWSQRTKRSTRHICLAIIIPPTENPYFEGIHQGMDDFVARTPNQPIELNYFWCSDSYPAETELALQKIARMKKLDGLILRGAYSAAIYRPLITLSERKIPIMTIDSEIMSSKIICYIGENHIRSGRMAAGLLAKPIQEQGNVAIVSGSSVLSAHALRIDGFAKCLKSRFPGISIVSVLETREDDLQTYSDTREMIRSNPDLKGILTFADCAQAVGQAIVDEGKEGLIKVVTFDFSDEVVDMIRDGIFDFTIGSMPHMQGSLALELMLDLIVRGKKPKRQVFTPVYIGMDENIDALTDVRHHLINQNQNKFKHPKFST